MATYKSIKGFKVQTLASDPVPGASGAWSSGGNLNTARYALEGAGTQTAGLAFGGDTGSYTGITESYNGSSWSEVADLNTTRAFFGACGLQTAALAFGGAPGTTANTELWNGSGWTEVNNLNTARRQTAGLGISTAALSVGGYGTALLAVNES